MDGSSHGTSVTVTVTYSCTVLAVTNAVTEESMYVLIVKPTRCTNFSKSMYHITLVTVSEQTGVVSLFHGTLQITINDAWISSKGSYT
jgi:hypothetical protein